MKIMMQKLSFSLKLNHITIVISVKIMQYDDFFSFFFNYTIQAWSLHGISYTYFVNQCQTCK